MTRPVVIVTGAAGGIGRAAVERFVNQGWSVLATDVASSAKVELTDEFVRYVQADVTDSDGMEEVVREAQAIGTLGGCVANAGVVAEDFSSFLDAGQDGWRSTFEVNVMGVMNTFQVTARALAAAGGGGAMVATASVSGVRAEPNIPAYCASKTAVITIVKSLALELWRTGIRVNAVAPGPVATDAQLRVIENKKTSGTPRSEETPAERFERQRNESRPIARLARPEEIAAAFSWLLSEDAQYVNGEVLVVDGGGVLA